MVLQQHGVFENQLGTLGGGAELFTAPTVIIPGEFFCGCRQTGSNDQAMLLIIKSAKFVVGIFKSYFFDLDFLGDPA